MMGIVGFVVVFGLGALCEWLVVKHRVGIDRRGVNVDGDDLDDMMLRYEESLKKPW